MRKWFGRGKVKGRIINKWRFMTEVFNSNMRAEIFAQPEVLRQLMAAHIIEKRNTLNFFELHKVRSKLKKIEHIIFTGNGSSYFAALYGNYIFEELSGVNAEFEFADELISRRAVMGKHTLLVALSQSGKTADVIKAAKTAKENKSQVIAVVNAVESPLAKEADAVLLTKAGEEKAVAATKSFTADLFLLFLFAMYFADLKGELENIEELISEAISLPGKVGAILKDEQRIKNMSEQYYGSEHFVCLGKNYQYPLALEAAQKIKETTYIHAEGYSSEEFLHGPKAIIEPGYDCLFFLPPDRFRNHNLEILKEIKNLGASTLLVTTSDLYDEESVADHGIYIPAAKPYFFSIISIIPIQLLCFYISQKKGIDTDRPRNIEKFIA